MEVFPGRSNVRRLLSALNLGADGGVVKDGTPEGGGRTPVQLYEKLWGSFFCTHASSRLLPLHVRSRISWHALPTPPPPATSRPVPLSLTWTNSAPSWPSTDATQWPFGDGSIDID